ncbi:sieve element occlusion [Artemisia annua]|uniref:Sieve element occlusion n=1 Tax=Artemisia annua TaxID=35608 RepID=A0A2U1KZP1_ARTAN|nr:sieve element occlusion [Artemisia annua]
MAYVWFWQKERSSSDDSAMMKQVFATHSPDGRDMDLEPILHVIEKTLRHAISASSEGVNDGTHDGHVDALAGDVRGIPDGLAREIHKISREFSCKCSVREDPHELTMIILNMLSVYTWEAKMVISLGAFSVNFGEFWLVAQLFASATNPLANSVALLKRLPNIIEHYKSHEPQSNAFNDLIKAILEVTKFIIAFKKLPWKSIAWTQIPTGAYRCIKSMVVCATQLTSLLGMNYEYIATSEAWVPLDLADMVHNFHKLLKEILGKSSKICSFNDPKRTQIKNNEKNHYAHFIKIEQTILQPKGIMEIIDALFGANPLLYGSSGPKVNVNELSKKNVLLLISDLDISDAKVRFLTNIYRKKQPNHQYEVVWVPVVDGPETGNDSHQQKLELLRSKMEWLVPSNLLQPAVIRYLKQVWHFEKKPILVVLDPQGRVTSPNALHMIWIWENKAYPFTSIIERDLWEKESGTQSWTQSLALQILVDSNDRSKWIAEEKHICFYGGDNLLWIREFTKLAADIAKVARIQLQMVYVGKSGTEERITKIRAKTKEKINATTSEKNLSFTWTDPDKVWSYWTHLESRLYSKMQHEIIDENDLIMEEVMTLMSFDRSGQGWALICKGNEMARVNADLALQSLEEFSNWKKNIPQIGFVPALRDYFRKLHKSEHCNKIILPWISGWIPKVLKCSVCDGTMEKFFMFRCCTD